MSKKATMSTRLRVALEETGYMADIPLLIPISIFLCLGFLLNGFLALMCTLAGCVLGTLALFDLLVHHFGLQWREKRPPRLDNRDAFDLTLQRRACRSFQSSDLSDSDRRELLAFQEAQESLPGYQLGSSPVRFEYVNAPTLKVVPAIHCREFLVALAPKEYSRMSVIDVGRCLQKTVIHATRMGLATCWIGPGADHASVIRHLGERYDKTADHIICVCAFGYKSNLIPLVLRVMCFFHHMRKPLTSLFFSDHAFQKPLGMTARHIAPYARCLEAARWGPSSFNEQPTRGLAIVRKDDKGETQLSRLDFYSATKSRYYAAVAAGIWLANWELCCNELGLKGHFQVLPESEREGISVEPMVYNVTWIVDSES